VTALEDSGALVGSIEEEVERLWSGHREGSSGLGEEDRAALAHNRELLSGLDLDSDEALGGRIRETLGRIDELLGDSPAEPEAGGMDVLGFLTAFREAAPSRPSDGAPKPVVVQTVEPEPEQPQPDDEPRWTGPERAPAWSPPAWTPPDPAPAQAAAAAADYWAPTTQRPASPPSAPRPVAAPSSPEPAPSPGIPPGRPDSRRQLILRLAAVAVFVVSVTTASLIAVHNNDAAAKWRHLFLLQKQVSTHAASQVAAANRNISTLNQEVKSLNGQVSTMQGQLSSVANQKEKAIDQTTVYAQLLAAAGTVADNLQVCITSTNQLYSDVQTAAASGDTGALPSLESEAQNVNETCMQAQAGNQELQAAIQSAS
jgi:hypothetical protein